MSNSKYSATMSETEPISTNNGDIQVADVVEFPYSVTGEFDQKCLKLKITVKATSIEDAQNDFRTLMRQVRDDMMHDGYPLAPIANTSKKGVQEE